LPRSPRRTSTPKPTGGRDAATKSGESAPDAGALIWIDFDPAKGHEQAGKRPALVLSPRAYNERTRLCIACPITNRAKGYPFEVPIPEGNKITGVVLADHLRSLSWPERNVTLIGVVPTNVLDEVREKIAPLLGIE
jgi:mRNA interferase MazF